ncbi:MAG: hypothetical protein BLM47_01720 [Candidatus Reconcilbacillus cellulovorans]|uniref:Uncharacterized protein n=1 Tax=Candidatus Reconcilbacillus cellulovorans TaxID=1906605 RepID=A0A2A6E380_9BACL|nr:MAG: hypothetical protein BLM47_01720 [Candidatus Reconcilbacillus cellulovorans]
MKVSGGKKKMVLRFSATSDKMVIRRKHRFLRGMPRVRSGFLFAAAVDRRSAATVEEATISRSDGVFQ